MPAAAMATSVPGADGDADIGLRQGGRIVDAIAYHGHKLVRLVLLPDALESLDLGDFIAGQHLGQHSLDADLFRNHLGGALVVAGDHHDVQAELAELCDGFP